MLLGCLFMSEEIQTDLNGLLFCSNEIYLVPFNRLKNLPFTFTKLKDLAALWLSDNQV